MDKLIGKGMLGQSGVAVIAIILVLQVVMPYVKGDDGPSNITHGLVTALEPLKDGLRDLKSLNENQRDSDADNAKAHQELTVALIKLASSVERVAIAVERLEK